MEANRRISPAIGVYVDNVRIESPPYDDPDVIQEFVGFGATRDFFLEPISAVTEDRIREFIDRWKDKVTGDRFRLTYTLLVRARAKRGARSKARSYVRAQNPFEPSVINVRSVSEVTRHSDVVSEVGPLSEFYDVKVVVSK